MVEDIRITGEDFARSLCEIPGVIARLMRMGLLQE